MSKNMVISRSDLLEKFTVIQGQFADALANAQVEEQKFENVRKNFQSNMTKYLQESVNTISESNPLRQTIISFQEMLKSTNEV